MDVAITLPAEPRSARAARRFVTDVLAGRGGEQWEMPAQLLVTELVTNAILHARTEMTVTVTVAEDSLHLRVRDGSSRVPAPRSYSPDATTGRGLALVDRLSSAWGVEAHEDGKTVWATITEINWADMFELEAEPEPDRHAPADTAIRSQLEAEAVPAKPASSTSTTIGA